ncbi:hypothetical protein HELRODRAFT_84897, partial [Helobdella robusta]|uniref:Transcription initiation factor IIA gamma subunit C-terminal domain-containing protein n=1 Tax=Helobdella robusta TaxID=6412 RepID=T1G5Q1_HELRO
EPLNSDDDQSIIDTNEPFDVDNVIVCQYEKIHRVKNRWKLILKSGIMNIDGKDKLFNRAAGDAEW